MATVRERDIAAFVIPTHGAYLISLMETTDRDGTTTPDELYSAASSLERAKRVARSMAAEMGWTGSPRWSFVRGVWDLTLIDEYNDNHDDEDDD